jgi:phosphoglucosamine mutase
MHSTSLFGTDGIRGRALEPPLDRDTVTALGRAIADLLGEGGNQDRRLLLAGDTRASTDTLAAWLGGGFQTGGGTLTWGGVLPTPAVSQLLRAGGWSAGVVISASHNPAHDNGIKVLGASGEKIADRSEQRIESRLESVDVPANGDLPPLPAPDPGLAARYLDLVVATHDDPAPLDGLHVVVDAAHGAASGLATELLERLGARVTAIASSPDGTNINAHCGATAPERLQRTVVELGADAGVALDGDADRAVLVDEVGGLFDGDDILLAWGRHLDRRGRLPGRLLVATVMSNFGLERALDAAGIRLIRSAVGDRSVWLAMRESGSALGGEQSGHVICAHHTVSGDGLVTGTHVLAIAAAAGVPLSSLSGLERMPQVLLNVHVARKPPFEEVACVARQLADTEARLGDRGRVLLRYSGTEPLARVMIEGEDADEIAALAASLADTIRTELS